ncbi:hypothetical protein BHE74_00034965 [Ensete ventricosum]|nr:hypothetical protein BHE74_00034965 [Ensete ventricosum]
MLVCRHAPPYHVLVCRCISYPQSVGTPVQLKEEEEATEEEEEEEEEEKVLLEMWRCAVRSLSDSCLVATYVRSIDCSIGGDTREPRGPRHSLEKWELGFPTSHMWRIGLW